jgi:pilus assembly protein CpaB
MPRQRIILIIGIVLALIAVFMIKVYLDQQRLEVQEQAKKKIAQLQANQAAVLVAKQDIPRGTVIEPDMLETAVVPNQFVQPQAVTSLDRIAGMITVVPISQGEQITLNKLSTQKGISAGGGLAELTPVGKRAITIAVDNIASLAGMIRPGDYVDVIAMIPVPVQTADGKQAAQAAVMPLFQNVLVLAVGTETSAVPAAQPESRYKKQEAKEPSPLITLALASQEASLIAFVQEQGKIRLTLRSPADSKTEPIQPASWDTLFQYLMPKEMQQKTPEQPAVKKEPIVPADTTTYIEIERGGAKEKVPLK